MNLYQLIRSHTSTDGIVDWKAAQDEFDEYLRTFYIVIPARDIKQYRVHPLFDKFAHRVAASDYYLIPKFIIDEVRPEFVEP